jgi:peptidoglycan hydrolase-like protein with peptidoglycan-binding domain
MKTMSKNIPEAALAWAIDIANDQSHGYSQASRWGNTDYDCSSLVISAYKHAGADTGNATYTGNMKAELLKHGFSDVTASINLASGANLKPGDILLYHLSGTAGHTALYAGQGQIVHARGQSYGSSAPGDQGSEIAVTPYYRGKWATVLRYTGGGQDKTIIRRYKVETELPMLQKGDTGQAVRVWQIIVGVDPDGEFGYVTKGATLAFQTEHAIEIDGVVGPESWAEGLKSIQ